MARNRLTDAQRWTIAGVAAVAVLLVVVLLVVSGGDDSDDDSDLAAGTSTTTTTEAVEDTTTSTEAETGSGTTTTTFAPSVDPFAVAFPSPTDSRRFDAPASAARSFATDVLGFGDLVLGGATSTGEATAEVVIQDREDGPQTFVSLEQLGDGAWYVVGAETEDIVVAVPLPGTSLASPFETSGEALAFEGSVEVSVLAQGDPTPLGQGVVTGSGVPPAGPFEGRITFTPPAEAVPGVLVYRITSPEDGRVVQATAVRVRLTPFSS